MANNCNNNSTPSVVTLSANSACELLLATNGVPAAPVSLWDLLEPKVRALLPSEVDYNLSLNAACELDLRNGGASVGSVRLWDILEPKVQDLIPPTTEHPDLDYDSAGHRIRHDGEWHDLNKFKFAFDAESCKMTWVDECGDEGFAYIPQNAYHYDAERCTLTLVGAKNTVLNVPLGVPADGFSMKLVGNQLTFSAKNTKCEVVLPRWVVDHKWDPKCCKWTVCYSDGSAEFMFMDPATLTADESSAMLHFANSKGSQFVDVGAMLKNKVPKFNCTNHADGSQTLVIYNVDGEPPCVINTQARVVNVDTGSVDESVLTLQLADGVITYDACALIAKYCNARVASYDDNGFTHVDNAGQSVTVPFPIPQVSVVSWGGVELNGQWDPVSRKVVLSLPSLPLRCETAEEGQYENVVWDAAAGMYTIPYKEVEPAVYFTQEGDAPPVPQQGKIWVDHAAGNLYIEQSGAWVTPKNFIQEVVS